MDDEHIDLSALDPARDPARWDARIIATAAAARAAVRRRASFSRAIAGLAIPAFALAAAAALAIWWFAPGHGVPAIAVATETDGAGDGLAGWALQGSPDGASLLTSLGGSHDDL